MNIIEMGAGIAETISDSKNIKKNLEEQNKSNSFTNKPQELFKSRKIDSTYYSIIDVSMHANVTTPLIYDETNVEEPCTPDSIKNNKGCSIQTYSMSRAARSQPSRGWDNSLWPGQFSLSLPNGGPWKTGQRGYIPWWQKSRSNKDQGSCNQSLSSGDGKKKCVWTGEQVPGGNGGVDNAWTGWNLQPRTQFNPCCATYVPIDKFNSDPTYPKFIYNAYYGWCWPGGNGDKGDFCYSKQLWIRAKTDPFISTAIDPIGDDKKIVSGLSDTNNNVLTDFALNTKDMTHFSGNGASSWCGAGGDYCKISKFPNKPGSSKDLYNHPQKSVIAKNIINKKSLTSGPEKDALEKIISESNNSFPFVSNEGGDAKNWGTNSGWETTPHGCPWWNCPDPAQETWGTKWTGKTTWPLEKDPGGGAVWDIKYLNMWKNFKPILPGEQYIGNDGKKTKMNISMPVVNGIPVIYKPFKTPSDVTSDTFNKDYKLTQNNYILTPQLLGEPGSFNILKNDLINFEDICRHINAYIKYGDTNHGVSNKNDQTYMVTASALHALSISLINDWFTYSSKKSGCNKPPSGLTLIDNQDKHYDNIIKFLSSVKQLTTASKAAKDIAVKIGSIVTSNLLKQLVPFPTIEQFEYPSTNYFRLKLTTSPQNFFYNNIFSGNLPLSPVEGKYNWIKDNVTTLETYCKYLCYRLFNDAYGDEASGASSTKPPYKSNPPVDPNYITGSPPKGWNVQSKSSKDIVEPTNVKIPHGSDKFYSTFKKTFGENLERIVMINCYDMTPGVAEKYKQITLSQFYSQFNLSLRSGTKTLPKYFAVSVTITCLIDTWSPWSKLIYISQLENQNKGFVVTQGTGICEYASGGHLLPVACAQNILSTGTDTQAMNILKYCETSTYGGGKISKLSCGKDMSDPIATKMLTGKNRSTNSLCACVVNGLQPQDTNESATGSVKSTICVTNVCNSDQRQLLGVTDDLCSKNKCAGPKSVCNNFTSGNVQRKFNFSQSRYKQVCGEFCGGTLTKSNFNSEFVIVFSIITLLVFFTSTVNLNIKKFSIINILITLIVTGIFGGITYAGGKTLNGCASCDKIPGGNPICRADFSWLFGKDKCTYRLPEWAKFLESINLPSSYCQNFNTTNCECLGTTSGSDPSKGTSRDCSKYGPNCYCWLNRCESKLNLPRKNVGEPVKKTEINYTYLAAFLIAQVCTLILFNSLKPVSMNNLIVNIVYLLVILIPMVIFYKLFVVEKVIQKTEPNCGGTVPAPVPQSTDSKSQTPDNEACAVNSPPKPCPTTYLD